jgi:hypothetical protein
MSPQDETSGTRRFFLLVAEAIIVFYLLLDALVAPIFSPFLRWVAKLRFVIRIEALVAGMPPYGILALLAIPFVLAEPAKLYGLILFATGQVMAGLVVFALAYFVSFVVVERIYTAGRDKLRTIGWFAKAIDWLFDLRDRALAWARGTEAWALFLAFKRRAADLVARLRVRFGSGQHG